MFCYRKYILWTKSCMTCNFPIHHLDDSSTIFKFEARAPKAASKFIEYLCYSLNLWIYELMKKSSLYTLFQWVIIGSGKHQASTQTNDDFF